MSSIGPVNIGGSNGGATDPTLSGRVTVLENDLNTPETGVKAEVEDLKGVPGIAEIPGTPATPATVLAANPVPIGAIDAELTLTQEGLEAEAVTVVLNFAAAGDAFERLSQISAILSATVLGFELNIQQTAEDTFNFIMVRFDGRNFTLSGTGAVALGYADPSSSTDGVLGTPTIEGIPGTGVTGLIERVDGEEGEPTILTGNVVITDVMVANSIEFTVYAGYQARTFSYPAGYFSTKDEFINALSNEMVQDLKLIASLTAEDKIQMVTSVARQHWVPYISGISSSEFFGTYGLVFGKKSTGANRLIAELESLVESAYLTLATYDSRMQAMLQRLDNIEGAL